MTDQHRTRRPRHRGRRGRHWLLAAAAAPVMPLLFAAAVVQDLAWYACVTRYGSPTTPMRDPCAASHAWTTMVTLAFWVLALAAAVIGVATGAVQGHRRRRFAHGRWISVSVVGLCTPWALLAYALGYGLGRLLPRRHHPAQRVGYGGWQQAVRLYAALANGRPPPVVVTPDLLLDGTVYMDVPFGYFRFYRMDVTYQPGTLLAVGSPGVVAGAAIGHLIGTSIGYARAASLSRRRWRGHRAARVVLTATATWCQVGNRWLCFEHSTVIDYRVDPDHSCVLRFADAQAAPLRLHGPSAWCHAVLFAYLRYGAPAWQHAPFLHPVRHAARQLTGTL